jgi:trk system potassium uptake protein TrkA
LAQAIGVDATVTPSLITAGEILRLVRGGPVMSLFMLLGGQAEIIEFLIRSTSPVVNSSLKDLALPKEALVTTIVRDNDIIVPRGDTVIRANDRLIVICKMEEVPAVKKLFGSEERKSGGGFWRRLKGTKFTPHR